MAYLYWLYNSRCKSPEKHGYVGATIDAKRRFNHHKKRRFKRSGIKMKILFEGSYEECLRRESRLRPHPGIGWNEFNGGNVNVRASERLKKRLKQSQKGRVVWWGNKISETMTGRKIGPPSKEHRENLSKANKGNPKVIASLNKARLWSSSEEGRKKLSELRTLWWKKRRSNDTSNFD